MDDILVDSWRAGWHSMRWDASLADQFFNRVPRSLTEQGPLVLDKIRSAFFDGAAEKALEIADDQRSEAVRRAKLLNLN